MFRLRGRADMESEDILFSFLPRLINIYFTLQKENCRTTDVVYVTLLRSTERGKRKRKENQRLS